MAWEEQEQFWRQALSKLNTWKRGELRAVHKPLLTLMLIAKAASSDSSRIHFVTIAEELTKLLKEFGPRRRIYHPKFPFWYLQTDGFWERYLKGPESTENEDEYETELNKILKG